MLGRAGIIYKDGNNKYFVNSECLSSPPYDVVIYANDIYYNNQGKMERVIENERKRIAIEVKKELESMDMQVEVFEN